MENEERDQIQNAFQIEGEGFSLGKTLAIHDCTVVPQGRGATKLRLRLQNPLIHSHREQVKENCRSFRDKGGGEFTGCGVISYQMADWSFWGNSQKGFSTQKAKSVHHQFRG